MEDRGHKISRKERHVWYREATYRKGLGFRGGLWKGTHESMSEWKEPPTHSEEISGDLQRVVLAEKERK